eukprot:1176576-Prorocentrum_minimum.AAC.2
MFTCTCPSLSALWVPTRTPDASVLLPAGLSAATLGAGGVGQGCAFLPVVRARSTRGHIRRDRVGDRVGDIHSRGVNAPHEAAQDDEDE